MVFYRHFSGQRPKLDDLKNVFTYLFFNSAVLGNFRSVGPLKYAFSPWAFRKRKRLSFVFIFREKQTVEPHSYVRHHSPVADGTNWSRDSVASVNPISAFASIAYLSGLHRVFATVLP